MCADVQDDPEGKIHLQWQYVSISAPVQASVVTDGSLADPLSGKIFQARSGSVEQATSRSPLRIILQIATVVLGMLICRALMW